MFCPVSNKPFPRHQCNVSCISTVRILCYPIFDENIIFFLAGTSRLIQVGGIDSKFLLEKSNSIFNISQRCLSSKNQGPNIHADLYKPSTAKEETHVPDALQGHHQSPETFATTTLNDGAKVW